MSDRDFREFEDVPPDSGEFDDSIELESSYSDEPVETESAHDAIADVADIADDSSIFYSARESLSSLSDGPVERVEPALKRLGPPPFVRKGFPFLGLLATIYDHVAQRIENEAEPRSGMNDPERDVGEGAAD
ncbi:MAG: hypothetical protein H6818_05415 [Phycisphaerales bacterium]|nr:hypothetical protein [Phycisphaerales bacterium]